MNDEDRPIGDPLALTRLLLATRMRDFGVPGLPDEVAARRMRGWGAWLDAALAAGFGAADAMASVPRATFALTVWGERVGLEELLGLSGASALERTRFASLAPHARAAGAWLLEDDEGFEGGFALRQVPTLRLRAGLPGAGVSRLLALAEELSLGPAGEVRRTVNPGAEATEVAFVIEGAARPVLDRAWRALVGEPAPKGIEALLGHAAGPVSLLLKAGERGLTGVGARVPIASTTGLAAGLAAVGADRAHDERLAAVLGALDRERPGAVDVMRRAAGDELRAWT